MTGSPTGSTVPPRWRPLILATAVEGGLAGVALLLGFLFGPWPLDAFRWTLGDVGWGIAATIPMVLGFAAIERWPVGPLKSLRKLLDEVLIPFLSRCSLVELAVISLLAGVGEELLFRGFLQAALQSWLGVWAALILASVVFGLFHALSFSYVVVATLLGLYLGAVWVWSGNLLVPVTAHALYDFLILVYLLRARARFPAV